MTSDSEKPPSPPLAPFSSAENESSSPHLGSVDIEKFSRNMARLFEQSGKVVAAYLKPREEGRVRSRLPDEISDVVKTLGQVAEYWLADPQRAIEAQSSLVANYMELWSSSLKRMSGENTDPVVLPDAKDTRFADPDWSGNQFFDFLKQAYLLTSQWAEKLVKEADGLDDHTRHKAQFYMKQVANAISPSNFVLTNPELLRETLAQSGENLVKGMHMLAEDVEAGGGELKIRQTDPEKFRVGENLAITPGKVMFQNELMQLIQYAPTTVSVYKKPLLIIPPWINKYYILDLNPEKSFIKWCVDQGLTVFCISWVNPDASLSHKDFENYMREGILSALVVIEEITGEKDISALGYCVGGTLLAVTLGYMAAVGDRRISSVSFLTTQVDFTHAGDLKVFVDELQLETLEQRMAEKGYLEGKVMAGAFNMMRSNDMIWPYVINNYMRGKAPFPFDLLYWNSDSTRMPRANHSFYLRHCYLENALAKGNMEIGGQRILLENITMPIFSLATREDHIAPARSVYLGSQLFGGPVEYVMTGSGHIAGVVNPPARQKYQYWTGAAPQGELEDWFGKAQEHPGSWWPHWLGWLTRHAPARTKARQPGEGPLKPIEDAPGSYVQVRS